METPASSANLVISEMQYAPAAPKASEQIVSSNPSDFEWIELMNVGSDVIELTDVFFAEGLDFSFTGSAVTTLSPGQRVLVVGNQMGFEARYGNSLNATIAGELGPSRLENAGERIHPVNALGSTIQDFTYGDPFPWPSQAGFAGYSLVLISDGASTPDHGEAENWRSSGFLGGAPIGSDQVGLSGGAMDDADGDGVVNLLEHALGTSNMGASEGDRAVNASVALLTINNVTDDYFVVSFQRKVTADDVILVAQMGSDLTGWSGDKSALVFVSQRNSGDGLSSVTYRGALSMASIVTRQMFFRLAVSLQ